MTWIEVFLLQAEVGLPVGILEPLPRTPHVFEPQERWPLENTPWEPALAWVPNYGSTRDHPDFAKAKFDEEIEEGLMEKMSPDAFKERFGDNTAIAALAVIVEDEEKDKKRLIRVRQAKGSRGPRKEAASAGSDR